jgi:hypothetical protein
MEWSKISTHEKEEIIIDNFDRTLLKGKLMAKITLKGDVFNYTNYKSPSFSL